MLFLSCKFYTWALVVPFVYVHCDAYLEARSPDQQLAFMLGSFFVRLFFQWLI